MRRAVEKHMEDPLAELVLKGDAPEGSVIQVSHDKETKKLTFTPEKRSEEEGQEVGAAEEVGG
jgi:ATP-dependent Clp protease ATP-binding subunit ClpC